MEDWNYQTDDFNEDLPHVELAFGIEDLYLLYNSVSYHYDKWPGGHPEEQEKLRYMKDFLFRVVLECKYNEF